MTELYKKHRPQSLNQMVGSTSARKMVHTWLQTDTVPHAILLTGSSGCGKTTVARILRNELGCNDMDFREINSADFRGIDMVRELQSHVGYAPVNGKCRVFLIDECHQLTTAAQDAILKVLEDTPAHVYFMLATTNPEKLKKTIRTRCTEVKLQDCTHPELKKLILHIAKKEKMVVAPGVITALLENSGGSARLCMVLLDSIRSVKDTADQLKAIETESGKSSGVFLGNALLRRSWPDCIKAVSEADNLESLRWGVLGYCAAILKKNGKQVNTAYSIIEAFEEPFFNSGAAGMLMKCYEIAKK